MTAVLDAPMMAQLNSMSKYPAIATYHQIDPATGCLSEPAVKFDGAVFATEKIDGTSARIIMLPGGDYLLASREELRHAKGDRLPSRVDGVADTLIPVADRIAGWSDARQPYVTVYYLEVYGGTVNGASRQYSADKKQFGARMFDVAIIPIEDVYELRGRPLDYAAHWRDHGGLEWGSEMDLTVAAAFGQTPIVPALFVASPDDLPTSVDGMQAFLTGRLPASRCTLDGGAKGQPEGIVFRTADRSTIAKARVADYARTARVRAEAARNGAAA